MRLNYNICFVVIEQIESVSMRTPSPQFNQELEDLRIEVEDLNVKESNTTFITFQQSVVVYFKLKQLL
jgi:hypothetical protein